MKHKIFRPENVRTEHSHSLFSERKSSVFCSRLHVQLLSLFCFQNWLTSERNPKCCRTHDASSTVNKRSIHKLSKHPRNQESNRKCVLVENRNCSLLLERHHSPHEYQSQSSVSTLSTVVHITGCIGTKIQLLVENRKGHL